MQLYPKTLTPSKFWVTAFFCTSIFTGCDDVRNAITTQMSNTTAERNAKVEQKLQRGLMTFTNAQVSAWREFQARWPRAKQGRGFAWHEETKRFEGAVSAVNLIEDRYAFKAILNFEISADYQEITFSEMRFHFAEVKRVIVPPEGPTEGGVSVLFQPDQKWLDLNQWRKLVETGWDFASLGIAVVSNAPVQNIQSALPSL